MVEIIEWKHLAKHEKKNIRFSFSWYVFYEISEKPLKQFHFLLPTDSH